MNNVVTAADISTYCTGSDFSLAFLGARALSGGEGSRAWRIVAERIINARRNAGLWPVAG